MKRIIACLLAALALFCLFLYLGTGSGSLTPEDVTAIEKAYAAAEKSVETHAESVRREVLGRKEYSGYVAERLTGLRATWVRYFNGEAALQECVGREISGHLINEQWSTQTISRQLARFVLDLRDVEDSLAQETGCYGLSLTPEKGELKGRGGLSPEKLELKDALQKQLLAELVSLVGAEVATQLMISGGILATGSAFSVSSLGVSLGVGLVVDVVVRWVMDPAEEVEQQLNDALDKAAGEHAELFRNALMNILNERRDRWTSEISELRSRS